MHIDSPLSYQRSIIQHGLKPELILRLVYKISNDITMQFCLETCRKVYSTVYSEIREINHNVVNLAPLNQFMDWAKYHDCSGFVDGVRGTRMSYPYSFVEFCEILYNVHRYYNAEHVHTKKTALAMTLIRCIYLATTTETEASKPLLRLAEIISHGMADESCWPDKFSNPIEYNNLFGIGSQFWSEIYNKHVKLVISHLPISDPEKFHITIPCDIIQDWQTDDYSVTEDEGD